MDRYDKVLRTGACAIVCALALRLLGGGILDPLAAWLLKPNTQAFLIYLETGRIVRFSPSLEGTSNPDGESPVPELPTEIPVFSQAEPVMFTGEDAALLRVQYGGKQRPDLETLLLQPLSWDLTGKEPTVLILHTHATESYTKQSESYRESSAYRTRDEGYNMLSIGDAVASALERKGIRVIHDRTLHDYPSYNGSYNHARASIAEYLKKYPSIRLVLDLHRDASGDVNNQLRTQATVNGTPSAQLMLVIGTGESGLKHEHWQDNLALGLKLHAQLESIAPGITRPLMLRTQRFNQDLSPGALLIEVGAAGNTHPEALAAAEVLAAAIADLALGANSG